MENLIKYKYKLDQNDTISFYDDIEELYKNIDYNNLNNWAYIVEYKCEESIITYRFIDEIKWYLPDYENYYTSLDSFITLYKDEDELEIVKKIEDRWLENEWFFVIDWEVFTPSEYFYDCYVEGFYTPWVEELVHPYSTDLSFIIKDLYSEKELEIYNNILDYYYSIDIEESDIFEYYEDSKISNLEEITYYLDNKYNIVYERYSKEYRDYYDDMLITYQKIWNVSHSVILTWNLEIPQNIYEIVEMYIYWLNYIEKNFKS